MKLVPVLDITWIRRVFLSQLGFERRGVELDRTREYTKLVLGGIHQRTVKMGDF